MRRILMMALVAAGVAAMTSTAAQATVAVSGNTYAIGSFGGQDCPFPSNGGFNNCWATQTGIVGTVPTSDPTASRVVASIAGNPGSTTNINSASYPSIDGKEFTVSLDTLTNSLFFTYMMGQSDPVLHYISIKQSTGYELFYSASGFTSGTTYSFALNSYFPDNPGYSHLTVFDSSGAVPEPATWAMMLLGFGGMGMAMRRSRRRNGATLMQIG